jgi:hypothetical protein
MYQLKEKIFYLCNIQTEHKIVRETTMLCCLLLLQGKSCWLYFEDKTVRELWIQAEYTLEIIRCDTTNNQLF